MVSKSFSINTADMQPFDSSSKRLLVELSTDAVTVILTDRQSKKPEAVESFHGSHRLGADWEAMVQQSRLLSLTDLETLVVIGYPNMIPVPASLYAPQQAVAQLELFFGPSEGLFTSGDVLKEQEMVVSWQIPLEEHDFLVNHFQWLQTRHAVSILIETYSQDNSADGHVLIYNNAAWLLLWKEGIFQIAKPVLFTGGDDISWFLLDTCRHFGFEPTEVHWKVSGMVEEGSSLWQAIIRFIDPVTLMSSTAIPEDLPSHYFAHLFKSL